MGFIAFGLGPRLSESQRGLVTQVTIGGVGVRAKLFSALKIQLASRGVLKFNGFVYLLH